MAINESLKTIRQVRGLTQEDVASKIGVTRQTISSYESNRTQPDIETLKRLAEIYDVELNDILYGKSKMQVKRRAVKVMAVITAVDLIACSLLQSILLWTINRYFVIEPGVMTEGSQAMLEARFAILDISYMINGFLSFSFTACCIVLFFLLMILERPVPIVKKLKYLAILAAGSAAAILPWYFYDNIYKFYNYSFTTICNLIFAFIMFILSFAGEYICNKFRY